MPARRGIQERTRAPVWRHPAALVPAGLLLLGALVLCAWILQDGPEAADPAPHDASRLPAPEQAPITLPVAREEERASDDLNPSPATDAALTSTPLNKPRHSWTGILAQPEMLREKLEAFVEAPAAMEGYELARTAAVAHLETREEFEWMPEESAKGPSVDPAIGLVITVDDSQGVRRMVASREEFPHLFELRALVFDQHKGAEIGPLDPSLVFEVQQSVLNALQLLE